MLEKVFLCILFAFSSTNVVMMSDKQGGALIEMKKKLNVPPNQLPDWSPNKVNPCTWSSIKCDENKKVSSIKLSSMGLNGTLSASIGVLTYLKTLILRDNKITGIIPETFGNLISLTSLDLENNDLNGEIPSLMGNLKHLEFLLLSRNELTGPIPESLSNLTSLITIQLEYNNLDGQIPERLFRVEKYNFTGNTLNCGAKFRRPCASDNPDSGGSITPNIGIIIGSIVGVLSFFGLAFLLWKLVKKGKNLDVFVDVAGEDDRRIAFGQLTRFSWRELQLATDSFSEKNILGQGGYGKVYKGVLADNVKIAVKRLIDHESHDGESAFVREIEMISVAVHRNLLKLIGFCTTPTERLLVYPLMTNLSVAHCLRELKPGEPILGWAARKRVALGTARGLEYLHEQCNPKIIHRDVKAANVLLDENFEALVGDFGLAKLVDVRQTSVTTKVRGTMGHIAPEYLSTGRSSEKTDVFGYGVLLLELVTGQRAIDFNVEEVFLLDHVKNLQRQQQLGAIVDCNLGMDYSMLEVEMMIQVALLCTQPLPEDRPIMSEVVRLLEGDGLEERWQEWQQIEVTRRQGYERLQRRFEWGGGEDSLYNQDAVELSGGR